MGPRFLVRTAGPRDAPDRPGGPARVPQGQRRHRLLQHHQVLHRGLPGAHQDHRQRDHPAQGAGRRRVLRPAPVGLAQAPRRRRGSGRRVELPVLQGIAGADGRRADATARPGAAIERHALPRPRAPSRPTPAAPSAGAARLRHPDRRRGARQSRAGLARARRSSTWPRPDARDDRAVPDASISDYLGVQTNNVAEYTGVVRALELARELGAREVAPAARLEAHRRAARRPLAGQGRQAIPLWTRGAGGPWRGSTLDARATCRARQNSRRRTALPTRRSTGSHGAAGPALGRRGRAAGRADGRRSVRADGSALGRRS